MNEIEKGKYFEEQVPLSPLSRSTFWWSRWYAVLLDSVLFQDVKIATVTIDTSFPLRMKGHSRLTKLDLDLDRDHCLITFRMPLSAHPATSVTLSRNTSADT